MTAAILPHPVAASRAAIVERINAAWQQGYDEGRASVSEAAVVADVGARIIAVLRAVCR